MTTKDKILKQTYKLYQEKGFNNVTIQDICKKTNITKPTFYKYFKNKEDTIIHLYDDMEHCFYTKHRFRLH